MEDCLSLLPLLLFVSFSFGEGVGNRKWWPDAVASSLETVLFERGGGMGGMQWGVHGGEQFWG